MANSKLEQDSVVPLLNPPSPKRFTWRRPLVLGLLLAAVLTPLALLRLAPVQATPGPGASPPPDAIAFDHTIHVGKYGMACLGCHVDARNSPSAGLPSVRKCMGCHKFVAKDKPAIIALTKLFEKGEAPVFRRIHDLPDYVYFSHRMHIAAQVACSNCHGDVGQMKRVQQVSPLTMGWCLDCHKQRKATLECVGCHK